MNLSDEQREKYFVVFTTIAVYTAIYPLIFYSGTLWGNVKTRKGQPVTTYITCNDIGIFDMYGDKQISTVVFFTLLAWGMKDKNNTKAWWWWIFMIIFGIWMVYAILLSRFIKSPEPKL